MSDILTPDIASAILSAAREKQQAAIFEGNTQKPFGIQAVTLDLSTARDASNPFKIGFPFKSVYVSTATDVYANVNMQPNSNDSFQSSLPLKQNDSWVREFPVSQAFLWWAAQSGKSITLLFFVDSEFRSGSQVSVTGGGVSIVEGSTLSTTRVDLTASTATLVLAADSTRKCSTIQNNTGAEVWFGGSSVSSTGAGLGYLVPAGATFTFKNTGALYAYSVGGGTGDNGLLVMTEV